MTATATASTLGSRLSRAIADEEQRGLVFAFRARIVAVIAVMAWLVLVIESQRQFYYLGVTALFFLLGWVPHLLRRHRHAIAIRFAFVVLDIILVTAVVILPPPGALDFGFPIQMRVRGPEFLYLVLLIVGSALSYSPLQVLWTGVWSIAVWSAGVVLVGMRSDTLLTPPGEGSPQALLRILMNPYYVGYFQLLNQVVLTAIATAVLAAAVWRSRALLLRQTRAEIARADLARYVSPDVADAIMDAESAGSGSFGAPVNRNVAVLFADVVGFTGLSERMAPDRVVRLLKSLHERGSAVVFAHGGSLDKYLGDGFLATFGGISSQPDAAARAIRCALALQEETARWNAKRQARGDVPVRLSVGVHYGPVVVGNIGSAQRLEFTVVGDTVNIASRLETLTRALDCRIAVSDATLTEARLHDPALSRFEAAGGRRLDGREQTLSVHIWPPKT
ncbi:MAG: adenylate/guanylate cyclase domain-containing protein [Ferrovibrio sp.]|uniref:adenylate/guanylate cyclase domain-containing protein n=1 Tax=Ferrovibrio sp. TaxID=1917215 RepID=UPI00263486CF|nr:adenylate/guanylate cyclase domain-containing protein [Ferrovibrio sp.]MCW0236670.1 adenylate/guanylate cyclase domain-containing protein [Ferrovibrio sp.]